jgi:hypothetical protein
MMTLPPFARLSEEERAQVIGPDAIEIGPDGTSLDLLRAVYRNSALPLPVRMRAAIQCMPFESPRLSVIANVETEGWAEKFRERLDAALARSRKVLESRQPKALKAPWRRF